MLNSETLEVAIGMVFLFLLMSLICTGVQEWLEGIFKWRAMDLERGVRTLLNDSDGTLTAFVYRHPLVYSLFQGRYEPAQLANSAITPGAGAKHVRLRARRNLPSYIPAVSFATALIDLVARGPVSDAAGDDQATSSAPVTVALLRERSAQLSSPHLRRVMLSALDHCGGDLERLRLNLQTWFDSSMDRASGWYKRRIQSVLFALGIIMACVLNVDALHVMQRLTADKAFRDVVVKEAASAGGPGALAPMEQIQQARGVINSVGMPVGWRKVESPAAAWWEWVPRQLCVDELKPCQRPDNPFERFYGWLRVLAGWLASALAVMLGAPFWFDTLNRLMVIRSTVKPREKSPEEGSQDRPAGDKAAASPDLQATVTPAPAPALESAPAPALESAPVPTPESAPAPAPVLISPPAESSPAPLALAQPFEPHEWRSGYVNPNNEVKI